MAKQKSKETKANVAWEKIIKKKNIIDEIEKKGFYKITADEIKPYREPRLMAKWDSSESLPKVFQKYDLNILPDTNGSYVLGKFLLYKDIPELNEKVQKKKAINVPYYESIDVKNITSEACAINVLVLSGILDDFLKTKNSKVTFNGRMRVGKFDYVVDTVDGNKIHIDVDGAQCEIDGGFENEESVIILEAKNVIHKDFHVRQLYYPYRLWKNRVDKPIRLVFSVYSNMIFRLFEYKFKNDNDYSSIELVQARNYSLQSTSISLKAIKKIRENTKIKTNDNQKKTEIPFPQADSFERVISLLEHLKDNPMTSKEIADVFQIEPRQSRYYFNAGRYIGLFEECKKGKTVYHKLSKNGEAILKKNYRDRQTAFVESLLEHRIFAELFDYVIKHKEIPEKDYVIQKMIKYNVCGESVRSRRAQTVLSWVKWVFRLTKL